MGSRVRCFFFSVALICLGAAQSVQADSAGTLIYPRAQHAATLLNDGRVLICGGNISANGGVAATATAEIYDTATRTWSVTGSMNEARVSPHCARLADGRVLVVGGDPPLSSAEIFDPATGLWSETGSMHEARIVQPVVLPTGKVLVAGGTIGGSQDAVSCELYDPATGTWAITDSLHHKRDGFQTTLLTTGKVLASGGVGGSSDRPIPQSELYDSAIGLWSDTGLQNVPRFSDEQLLLMDGRVLVTGGVMGHGADRVVIASSEAYIATTGRWKVAGSLATARESFTANLLGNGTVLAAGGLDDSDHSVSSIELFDPNTNKWKTPPFALMGPRYWHTGTSLLDGSVLIAGGYSTGFGFFAATAEVFRAH